MSRNEAEYAGGCVVAHASDPRDLVSRLEGVNVKVRAVLEPKDIESLRQPAVDAIIAESHPDVLDAILEAQSHGLNTPIVCMTASDESPCDCRHLSLKLDGVVASDADAPSLREAVDHAADRSRRLRRHQTFINEVEAQLANLSAGHRDVLRLLMTGEPNKSIARELGVSIRTVEDRRAKIMRVTESTSFVFLVKRMALYEHCKAGCANAPNGALEVETAVTE